MPNPIEEFQVAEKFGTAAFTAVREAFSQEATEIPSILAKAASPKALAQLADKLETLAPGSQMRELGNAVLDGDHAQLAQGINDFYRMPTAAREMLKTSDITGMIAKVRSGTPADIQSVMGDLSAAKQLSPLFPADLTEAQYAAKHAHAVIPNNIWTGT